MVVAETSVELVNNALGGRVRRCVPVAKPTAEAFATTWRPTYVSEQNRDTVAPMT